MTVYERVEVKGNSGLQVYISKVTSRDSAFPLSAGDECLLYPAEGTGVVIVPIEDVDDALADDTPLPAPPDGAINAAIPPPNRPDDGATVDDLDIDADSVLDGPDHACATDGDGTPRGRADDCAE